MSEYLGIIVVLIITAALVIYVRNLRNIEKENLRLQKNLNLANQFFDEVNEQVEDIRRYRHDLRKHIRIVEEFLKEGKDYADYEEYKELVRLMSGMQQGEAEARKKRFCDHEVLNAICEIKKKECDDEGISFEVDIDSCDLSFVDDFHLTGIVMNLLDNAQEAQQRIGTEESKLMTLTIKQVKEEKEDHKPIIISVGNTISKAEKLDFKTKKEDKKHHGMGLDIAREYAQFYGGELTYQYDEKRHFLLINVNLIDQGAAAKKLSVGLLKPVWQKEVI